MSTNVSPAHDPLLFTPGPLTTSLTVKQRMLRDIGSWERDFAVLVSDLRSRLLNVAGLPRDGEWTAVLLQGSGTYGVEAVLQTCVPPKGKVAVLANGAYGERLAQILEYARIQHVVLRDPEDAPVNPETLDQCLANDRDITHVAVVHCETTTGMLNPIEEIGTVVKRHGRIFIVDAMSSFGGMQIDFEACAIDYLVSSANKCIEGVPGFSCVFCRKALLLGCAGWSRSLSLDLVAQFKAFEQDGKFRFTPPTHALLAFQQALAELNAEGGVTGRNLRYRRNHSVLHSGMLRLGFSPFLDSPFQSPFISAFHYPRDFEFNFGVFHEKLRQRGFVIYPGKLTRVDTFRIGTIGRIFEADILALLSAIRDVLAELGIIMTPTLDALQTMPECE
ncbi:MAG TPA: 2-aminoethylphosphonate--pyruvate transaminase [Verrucomicrobiae bacterium]|nr:2-aminoethylphosphonate--pyruvate transaminase [Verrucomicrobiae bacterium]